MSTLLTVGCGKKKSAEGGEETAAEPGVPVVPGGGTVQPGGNSGGAGDGVVTPLEPNPGPGPSPQPGDSTDPSANAGADLFSTASASIDATANGDAPLTFAWTKVSGPGALNFSAPTAEDTQVSADTDGAYLLRLTVTDRHGVAAFDEVWFTKDSTQPLVDAGSDALAGATAVHLSATASDASTISYAWTQVSGPGTANIAGATQAAPDVTFDADGTYVLRLTVTDALGNAGTDDVTIVRDTVAPTVAAGVDQLSGSQVALDGSATDGLAVTYLWTKVAGSGAVTFGNAAAEDTTAVADQDGAYTLRLTAVDAVGNSAFDDLVYTRDTLNPVVDAGPNRLASGQISLDATASDVSALTYAWSKISGPGAVTFGSDTAEDTTVSASADGAYVLRLTVTDAAGHTASDDMTLTLDTLAPTVDAGAGGLFSASMDLDGSASDASSLTYAWTKVSGPGSVSFATSDAQDTSASASADGTYVLRLTVTDAAGNSASDDVTVERDATAPAVDAGPNRTLNAAAALDAAASDASSLTLAWTKVSGPGAVSFSDDAAEDPTVFADQDGTYVLRLTATDAAGNSAQDQMTFVRDTAQPSVDAGLAQITQGTVSLDGFAGDATAVSFSWSKHAGAGNVSFGSATSEDTSATADADGDYILRLTATDSAGNSAFDDVAFTRDSTAPSVNAGSDFSTGSSHAIDASSFDVTTLTYAWSQVSGPGTTNFSNAAAEDTTVSADADGVYVLRLTATDAAGNSASDDVQFLLDTGAPVVDVGADRLDAGQITVDATASDATTMSYAWTKAAGPGAVTFGSANAEDTTVDADQDGVYTLRLTATDAGNNAAFDELSFTKDSTAPTVDAGSDQTSATQISQDAVTSDATALTYAWTKQSGPGTVTFGSATAEDTTISASADGSYVLRLTATDAAGNSAFDDVVYLKDSGAPAVNVGADQTASTQISINATATDATAMTYAWTKQSGPGSITFGSATAEDTTASASADGVYVLRLTATDASGNSSFDELTYTKDSAAPSVNAGADATSSTQVAQDATATDATATTYAWTKQSGPGVVTFGSATAEDTTISASSDGSYVIRLTVTDAAGNSAFDEMTYVKDSTAPSVNAGADLTSTTQVSIDATTSDATNRTYAWTKQSGPGTVTFGSATAEDTTASASADGVYVLRLTVTDAAGNSAFDEMTYTKDSVAPSVDAGADRTTNVQVTQDATATDATAMTYAWTKQSGPGSVTFGSASSEDTTISTSNDGTYVIRLTVTDAAGNSAFDELTLVKDTVAPTVDAGTDATSTTQISQNATATDGLAMTYAWTKQSGAGTITFGSASAEDTTISASSDDSYVIRLTVTDAAGNSAFDELTYVKDSGAPAVNAGADKNSPTQVSIDATVTDATALTYAWTKQSGPGTITFGSASAVDTTASASTDGTYVLRLTATDAAGNSAFDELTYVKDTSAPSVNAGIDVTANAQFTRDATSSDNQAMTYAWTKQSGSGTITFGTATAEDTTISASADGVYVLRLTATDAAGNATFDDFTLTWDTTAPAASLTAGLPSAYSSTVALGVSVGGTDVTQYMYKVRATSAGDAACSDASGYSSATDVANAIVENISAIADGTVRICAIGRDLVGNWQTYASAATYTWTKDTTAPVAGGSGVITASSITPVGLSLDWTAGTDNLSAQANLEYRTCRSTSASGLLSEADMLGANCTLVQDWTAASTSANASSLTSKTQYYWRTMVRDQAGNTTLYGLLSQNSMPVLHVAYNDRTALDLKYATNSAGTFSTSILDSTCTTTTTCIYASLAMDTGNKPHVSYVRSNGTNNVIYYADKTSGSWSTPAVAYSAAPSSWNSLAIDGNGKAHLSIYDTSGRDLEYTTNASDSWVNTSIATSGVQGAESSIVVDSNNKPHIAWYYNSTNDDLMYANKVGASWSTPLALDSTASNIVGRYPSMAIDGNGYLHIAYYNQTAKSLKYSTNAPSGTWNSGGTTVEDVTNDVGTFASIAVSNVGSTVTVDIVYRDATATSGDLKYATCTGAGTCTTAGNWTKSTIDSASAVGAYPMGFDKDTFGNLHVTYNDETTSRLLYLRKINGTWDAAPSVIDASSGVGGRYSSAKVER